MTASPYESQAFNYDVPICIGAAVGVVLLIVMLFLTHMRSEEWGMNTTLWMIVVFLFGIFGYLFFLFAAAAHRAEQKRLPGKGHPDPYGQPEPSARGSDPGFRDYEIEDLIEDGKLREARKYLQEMCKMAREMGDDQGYQNYKSYESKINQAAVRPGKGSGDY